MFSILDSLIILLSVMHFGIPLVYYKYLGTWLKKPWNLVLARDYEPNVSVILPTYNEQAFIWNKLSDLAMQNYPMDKVEIIVVDSASTDQTVDLVEAWRLQNPAIKVRVIREQRRDGKAKALNLALKQVKDKIVVVTDADCVWDRNSLREIVKWLSDSSVGAVTGTIEPTRKPNPTSDYEQCTESTYRSHYNIVRVAESKIYSTPIFNGPLMAFRKDKLEKLGGFPLDCGADDSYTAVLMVLEGCRSICVPDAIVYEPVPISLNGYLSLKVRRGLHLVHALSLSLRKMSGAPAKFRRVIMTEAFIHLINPWLFIGWIVLYSVSFVTEGATPLKLVTLVLIAGAMAIKKTRQLLTVWIMNQLILAYSSVKSLFKRELSWEKISK